MNLFQAALVYEGFIQAIELEERHHYYRLARDYCSEVSKPLLRIGMRRSPLEPPNGDVTLDIDPSVERVSGGVLGDVRAMPFAGKQFGVCFNEHVLEHLRTASDVQVAVAECCRVADYAILLAPSPYSIVANLHPGHHLRLWFKAHNQIVVEQLQTAQATMRQAMVVRCGLRERV